MAEASRTPSRRQFLQALGAVAVAWSPLGCGSACGGAGAERGGTAGTRAGTSAGAGASPGSTVSDPPRVAGSPGRPRVVVVKAKRTLTSGYDADRGALRTMLAAGLTALTGAPDAGAALRRFFKQGETVGLKVNGLAGRQAATHFELVDEVAALLRGIDVAGEHQVAFDRLSADLVAAGFTPNDRGDAYRCQGNDALGYEEEPALMPSSASRLCRVLTERITGVLNLPVLKQHMLSGVTGALKNQFGCIDNPNKMHLERCDPYIAEVNAIPQIRSKQRLIVMDALRPVVDLGPSYQPGMAEAAHALLLGVDPVAIDTVGLELLEALRKRRGLPPLAGGQLDPIHLQTAARMGLGVAERARIEVVTVEV
ncbi:MAG: DUF362 domain-containing protein [Deltaproteobacteria bacterium]|nr:DUF362 domain-containing protein [Deltaproteobacteria bacterium]